MKKTTRTARKVLSVFLAVLMMLTTWAVAVPGLVLAADTYYVRVYLNIYDGANSDGYGNPYTVVTDSASEFYGKPDDYKWDYGSSFSATDNSKGYDGKINMAGFTLFYDNDKKYETYDLNDDLVAATTTLGNNWTSMDDLTLENFASWPNKVEKVYGFELNSMPSSLFWINDENNAINGETSFGIHKITVAQSSTGEEHTLWTGLSGSESYYECYYGTITPTGLITPWDDCPDAQTYTFYKDYTTSAVGTWIDPYNAGEYNTYPVNNYLSGGVSATFTVGNSGSQTNIDYVDVGNTNNYYINFTNHSTQAATVTLFKADNKSLVSGYSDGFTLASGQTQSFVLNKGSMSGDGTYYDFSFKYKLDNVYNSDGTTQSDFYQAAGICTWNTSDDLKAIGLPAGESSNNGFTLYQGDSLFRYNIDISNRFMVDVGILEEVSTSGNRTTHVDFVYNYWFENAGITDWSQTGLRLFAEKYTNYRHVLQENTTDGTLAIGGNIANSDASLSMADLVKSYTSASDSFNLPDPSDRPWAYIGSPCVPQWNENSNDEWSSLVNIGSAYFRFCGVPFKANATSSDPGTITFTNMVWRDYEDDSATFSGTINVYTFDKTDLRNYVYSLGGLGANWAPMRNRFSDAQWNAYEIALKTAKEVLANQKTNQKAVTDAYNALYSATEALKATASLKSQVAEATYTKRATDYESAATDTTSKYIIMPIGTETAVPAYDTYKYATTDTVVGKQTSNLKTNYTQYDTGINPIDYRYWKIDFTGVVDALSKATEILDTPLETYSDSYYEKLQDARTALSAFDRDADTWTPTHQSDIDNALAALNDLLAHDSTDADAHNFIKDDQGVYVVKYDDTTHWYECEVCGYKYMHENHTVVSAPADADTHTVECTYVDASTGSTCDFAITEAHKFENAKLTANPVYNEETGEWSKGIYTLTCVCGETDEIETERADYSEFDKVVEELKELNNNENLTDDAKTEIAEALEKAENLPDNLVTAEQDKIDTLVKELQGAKDSVEKVIDKQLGFVDINEATSGIKVQFLEKTGVDAVEYVQLDADGGFETVRMRLTNSNANLPITVTSVVADNAYIGETEAADSAECGPITIDKKGSADLYIVSPANYATAGIITYTINYKINNGFGGFMKDASGNDVVFTTKAYLYVKAAAFTPYHLMDETCNNGPATAKWEYSLESLIGDFAPIYNNKAPKAEFGNDNLVVEKDWVRPVYHKYDYEDNKCYAECTGTGDTPYVKGDAHAATYRYYIDTSLAPTWQDAGFKAVIAEGVESKYDYAIFDYIRLANNKAYLDSIQEDNKTFSVTVIPGASSNVPTKTWTATSTGDDALTVFDTSDVTDFFKETEYLFGNYLDEAQTIYTAYTNFSGSIPQNTEDAKMMFSYRIGYNMAEDHFLGGVQAESTTMTTHLYITSYDKADLREAVEAAELAGYNSKYFDEAKYEAYEDALADAKEVLGKAETNQAEVDAATKALNDAIADLSMAENEAKYVLTVTHSIHESADKNSEATATEYDYYLVNGAITPALNADIIALDTINKYDATVTLNVTADAEHTYNYWYIDYSGVQDAINAAEEIINDTENGYSEDYKQQVEDAKNALEEINKTNADDSTTTPESQDDVDDAIDAVTALTGHDCADNDKNHNCDICGTKLSDCADNDNNHNCDVCGTKLTDCTDAAGDGDHDCDVCGAQDVTEHDYADATCLVAKTCNECGATDGVALGHDFDETVEENPATCLAPGNVAYKQCTVCNLYFAANAETNSEDGKTDTTSFVIAQLDHSYTGEYKWNNAGETKYHSQKCVNGCDGYGPENECTFETTTEAPTCTVGGTVTHTCTVCNNSYQTYTSANGHSWSNWNLTTAPTADTQGEYTRTCSVCSTTETKAVEREDYSAYDEAVNRAEDMLKDDTLTNAAKAEIQSALTEAQELDQNLPADVVEDDKTIIDNDSAEKIADATNALTEVLDKIANDKTGAYEKPDYTDAEKAIENAENIGTLTDEEKATLEDLKEDLEEIKNKTNPEANAKDDQTAVDAIENAAQEIVNKYADCADGNHAWNSGVLTRPSKVNGAWVDGYYTYTCTVCGTTKTETVARAVYTEYDKAVADLNDLLADENLTDAAKAEIEKVLSDNAIADNLIATEQDTVDAAAAALKVVLDKINDNTTGAYVKPDSDAAEEAVAGAEALEEKIELPEDVKTQIDNLKTELNDILDDISKDDNATAEEYQDRLDAVEEAAQEILDKYAGCENGHTWGEGVLTRPEFEGGAWVDGYYTYTCTVCGTTKTEAVTRATYTAYDEAVAGLNALLADSTVTDAAKAEIEKVLSDNAIADDLITTEQSIVDDAAAALKVVLDKIANDETGAYEKVNYTEYNAAVNAYEALKDTMTDTDKAAVEAIKAEIAEIPADGSKKDYQTQVDKAAADIAAINAKYADCSAGNHIWGEPVLTTAPTADTQGEYTETCGVCGTTQITKVDLADYDAFNDAVDALENLLTTENLTDDAKADIEEALDKAEALDKNLPADVTTVDGKLIEGGQDEIDALVTELNQVVTDTTADIADGSALEPDYEAWEEAETAYDALIKTNVKPEIITEADALKAEIAGKQADDTLTQATATQVEINAATARLNEIIEGINNGTLKNPDYTEVDKDLADAKDKAENNDVVDGVKEDIKEIEDKLNEIKNDPATNANDQPEVDALEDQLEEIIKGIEDGTLVNKYVDLSKYNEQLGIYNNSTINVITDEDKADIDNVIASLNGIDANTVYTDEAQAKINAATAALRVANEKYAECAAGNHIWNDPVLTKVPTADEQGEYTEYCDICKETQVTKVSLADYSKLAPAVDALEELLATDKLTDEAKAAIEAALEKAENIEKDLVADVTTADGKVIKGGQDKIDALVAELENLTADTKADIADGSALEPDYEAWEEAETAYDGLDKTGVKAEIITEANNLKAEIAGKQGDDTLTQATATQVEINAATDRLNDIIDGINDGSLKDPDYSNVEDKLTDANNAENLNKDTQDKIDAIEDALEEIKGRTEPKANARDDQDEVDALEDQLDEILADIADGTAKAPDYTEWNTAEGTYDTLDKSDVKDDILTEVDSLKQTIDALKEDPTANGVEDQQAIDDATARLNEIITGINDGSLKDPDYSKVEDKLADANDADNLTDETKDKIDEIENALEEIKNKEPEANARDDQTAVDALEDQLDEILEGINDGSLVKPDYSEADKAIADAEKAIKDIESKLGNSVADGEEAVLEELKNSLEEIRNDASSNKKDDQSKVDSIANAAKEISKKLSDTYAACIKGNHVKGSVVEVVAPTCTEKGYTKYRCDICGTVFNADYVDATGHIDENDDGTCDICGATGLYDGCACLCHNNHWFWRIVYMIFRIIWKIFKIHPVCACGRIHY